MTSNENDYAVLLKWKKQVFSEVMGIHSINCMFDRLLTQVLEVALKELSPEEPPCRFAWFMLGSSGRSEQTFDSDQDHAIVFQETGHEAYFLKLGQKLADILHFLGYDYCPGNVMSNNPFWCRSEEGWLAQIIEWQNQEELTAIRNYQIMLDARFVYGDEQILQRLRNQLLIVDQNTLGNLASNMSLIKKGLTPVGALVVERVGPNRGCLDFKNTIYIPYVNSIRLLSIYEGIDETTTKQRIKYLQPLYGSLFSNYYEKYDLIMDYRLNSTAFIDLNKANKKELKELIRYVKKLHDVAINRIGIRC